MTLTELTRRMREYDHEWAPGSETVEWGDFVEDCRARLGMMPWDDRGDDITVPPAMASYWRELTALELDVEALRAVQRELWDVGNGRGEYGPVDPVVVWNTATGAVGIESRLHEHEDAAVRIPVENAYSLLVGDDVGDDTTDFAKGVTPGWLWRALTA